MLERIQKSSFKVILKEHYKDYENALKMLNMQTLYDRRERKCLTFAKKCLKEVNLCKMFPLKNDDSIMYRRKSERYKVIKSKTCRLQNSPIIYMQNLLNKDYANILIDKKFQKNTRSDMKIQKYSSIQVFKYLSIQVFNYSSIQLEFDN